MADDLLGMAPDFAVDNCVAAAFVSATLPTKAGGGGGVEPKCPPTGAGLRGSDPHVPHHRLLFKTHPIETYLLIMPATEQLLLGSPMGTFEFLDK